MRQPLGERLGQVPFAHLRLCPLDRVRDAMEAGQRALEVESKKEGGHTEVAYKWSEISKGTQTGAEYDATVRDLVNFLVYVSEPHGNSRRPIGIIVLFVLAIVFVFAYLLKKEYWKDVK